MDVIAAKITRLRVVLACEILLAICGIFNNELFEGIIPIE
jgi:hypothetical protein